MEVLVKGTLSSPSHFRSWCFIRAIETLTKIICFSLLVASRCELSLEHFEFLFEPRGFPINFLICLYLITVSSSPKTYYFKLSLMVFNGLQLALNPVNLLYIPQNFSENVSKLLMR